MKTAISDFRNRSSKRISPGDTIEDKKINASIFLCQPRHLNENYKISAS